MQRIMLSNLKLSVAEQEPNYVKCCKSVSFPGYYYYVSADGRVNIERDLLPNIDSTLFERNPEEWLLSVMRTSNVVEFETELFEDFSDVRNILSRMIIVPSKPDEILGDTEWLDFKVEQTYSCNVEQVKVSGLPTIAENELLTFAEFDAVINLLKAKQSDKKARKYLYISVLETLLSVEESEMTNFDSALDVMFANLVVAIQMIKNVCPVEALRLMSFVMKAFVLKERRATNV